MSSLVLGTAGHIDHGKSALVLALTGTDPDRLKEEKARGITIDLGFAHAKIGRLDVSFVDVPGHERFVRTMAAGVGGIDAVLFVIAADESVMPQTREHLAICRYLGIDRGIVVLTKSDVVDEDTCAVAALEAGALVAGTFLEGAPIVPVSARTGAGLERLREAIAALGPGRARQSRPGVARLPVDRAFSLKGFGTVVTGTLVSGQVAKADEVEVLPGGRRVRVRGIQVHGTDVQTAVAPCRAALNLAGVEVEALARGVTLATPGTLAPTTAADAWIEVARGGAGPADDGPGLRHGSRIRVLHGTSDEVARAAIVAVRDNPRAPWRPIAVGEARVVAPPGAQAFVRLRFERPAVLTRLDRFVVRGLSPAGTIGGGVILDPEPPSGRLRRSSAYERFQHLAIVPDNREAHPFAGVAALWVGEAGDLGLATGDLVRRGGVSAAEGEAAARSLTGRGAVQLIDGRWLNADVARRGEAAAAALAAPRPSLAAADPAERALRLKIEAIVRQAGLTPPDAGSLAASVGEARAAVDRALAGLAREGRLVRAGDQVFHPEALSALRDAMRALAADAGGAKTELDVAAFKARYGVSRKYAIPLLEWLDRERVTRRVGAGRVLI